MSLQLQGARTDLAALASAVRARAGLGPLSFREAGDLLSFVEDPALCITGDAEALETLATALDDVAARGRHHHVPLYGAGGREIGELIVAAP